MSKKNIFEEYENKIKRANEIALEAELKAQEKINNFKIMALEAELKAKEKIINSLDTTKEKEIIKEDNELVLMSEEKAQEFIKKVNHATSLNDKVINLDEKINKILENNSIGNLTIFGKVINFNQDFNWDWDVINNKLDSKIFIYSTDQYGETYQANIKNKGEFFNNIGISGIYSSYLWIDDDYRQQDGYYLFPPKIMNGIEIKNNSKCLCSINQKIDYGNDSKSSIKLIKADRNLKGNISIKSGFNGNRNINRKLPYIKITAFDKFNRSMTTISDEDGNFTLKLIEKDYNSSLFWSIKYELPKIDDLENIIYGFNVYNKFTNSNEYIIGTDGFYVEHNGEIVYPTYIVWVNNKFEFVSYNYLNKKLDEDLSSKYLLPNSLLNHLSKLYNTNIKSNNDVLNLVNSLSNIVYYSNPSILKNDQILIDDKELPLPFDLTDIKKESQINIITSNLENYINLKFKISKDKNLNISWNNIKINLYYKKGSNDEWVFYSNCNSIIRSRNNINTGTFNCLINKNDLSNTEFKLEVLTPNDTHPLFKIKTFSIKIKGSTTYSKTENKFKQSENYNEPINNESEWKEPLIEFIYDNNSEEYIPIFNNFVEYEINNNFIEILKNNRKKIIKFYIPEEIRNNENTKNIFGTIIASVPETNLIVSKKFNLLEYKKGNSIFESSIELFEQESVWKIEYKLQDITAENAKVYKENINNHFLRDNNNEIELAFHYLNKNIELSLHQDNKLTINTAYCILKSGNFNHNLEFKNGIATTMINSNLDYDIEFSLGYNLLGDYLPPNKQNLDLSNLKFDLIKKDCLINVKINTLEKGIINNIYYNCINENGIELSEDLNLNNTNFTLNLTKDNTWDIFITAEVKIDNKVFLFTDSKKVISCQNTNVEFNLVKSNFPFITQKRFIIKSNVPNKLEIIKEDNNLQVKVIIPENSLVKNNKNLFLTVKGSYQYLNNKTTEFITPFVIDCYDETGQKITNCLKNKYFKYNIIYKTDILKNTFSNDYFIRNLVKTATTIDIEIFQNENIHSKCDNCSNEHKLPVVSNFSNSSFNQRAIHSTSDSKSHLEATVDHVADYGLYKMLNFSMNWKRLCKFHINMGKHDYEYSFKFNKDSKIIPEYPHDVNLIRNIFKELNNKNVGIIFEETDDFFDSDISIWQGKITSERYKKTAGKAFTKSKIMESKRKVKGFLAWYKFSNYNSFWFKDSTHTLIHEIGHCIGLEHTHDQGMDYIGLPGIPGSLEQTVMTYNFTNLSLNKWYDNIKFNSIHFGPIDYLALDKLWNGPSIKLEVSVNLDKLTVQILNSENSLDWVGIFNKDEVKDEVIFSGTYLKSRYVNNKKQLEFDISLLNNNDYDVYLFKNNTYIVYDKKVFSTRPQPYIEIELKSNKLTVQIFNSDNPLDWVGIFNKGEIEFVKTSLMWLYTENKNEIVFDISSLGKNDYDVYLFKDNGYTTYDKQSFQYV